MQAALAPRQGGDHPTPTYVLHAFQKKAKRGAETPRQDIELVRNRLRTAEQHYRHAYGEE